MNLPELKQDFYRRGGASDSFLHFEADGFLCPLLGHIEYDGAPVLTVTLSMCYRMLAREIGGRLINIESSSSDRCFTYRFGTPPRLYRGKDRLAAELINSLLPLGIRGAQILYDCSIPEFLPRKEVFAAALAKSILKVSSVNAETLDIAEACMRSGDIRVILGILSARSGYCTLLGRGEPKSIPLPLTGYKLITVHCTEKDRSDAKYLDFALEKIRRVYPHVTNAGDISPKIAVDTDIIVKDKAAAEYVRYIASENLRVAAAKRALEKCDVKTLFLLMNKSQKAMERLRGTGKEKIYLARLCAAAEGVSAARMWSGGVLAVTDEAKVDYVIDMVCRGFETAVGYQPTFCVCDPL